MPPHGVDQGDPGGTGGELLSSFPHRDWKNPATAGNRFSVRPCSGMALSGLKVDDRAGQFAELA
jgi:hypothetical protein